jgi:outer membrane receptor protein involved in Fe transport
VVILNEDTGISRTVLTNVDGYYSAPSLSLGNYKVTGTLEGFRTEVRTGIVLAVAQEDVVDLSLALGSVSQSVVVSGAAPLVETTSASLNSLVDDKTIRELPLNGRSWDQLAELQPGVARTNPGPPQGNQFNFGTGERFSVSGQRPDTNLFLLDGTNINDQANGTPGGAAGTNLGVDTILEFKIFTNSYKAEYGHSMGSVTTAVTRSGTNTLHGTAFEYIRNHVLDARNYFDAVSGPPPFIRNQFGGVLGGPIKRDKTFFFAGYEGLRQGLGTTLIATVPTALARQGILPNGTVKVNPVVVPYLNLYPLPNGRDFGDGTAQFLSAPTIVTNEDNAMGRIDHQLTAKTALFARYTYDQDSVNSPQSLPFEFAVNTNRRQYITLQTNTVISTRALNSFRFGYNQTKSTTAFGYTSAVTPDLSFVPGQPMGSIQFGAVGTSLSRALTMIGGTNGNGPNSWDFNIFHWGDEFSYSIGKHSFKAGVDIQKMVDNYETNGQLWGIYTFTTFSTFLRALPSNLQVGNPVGKPFFLDFRQTLLAFYGQDDYKINSRLTLNLGLRWETTTNPYDALGKTALLPSLASPNTVVSSSFFTYPKKTFEPRVGLAWQLTGSGKTVLRAGAGIYHNQIFPWFYQIATKLPPFGSILSANNPPFPDGISVLAQSKIQLLAFDPNQKTPSNIQYNLSLQQEIFKNTMLQVAYAGNRASHLVTEIEGDTPIPTICSTALNNCPPGVPNGAPFYPLGAPRRNPAWNGIRYYQSNGKSEYDSATITLRHQSSSGLLAQVFYTFSKALDDSSTDSPGSSLRSPQSIMYPQDYTLDWGLSDFDSKHALVGSFTYPLPFKVGSRSLGLVVNGWRLDGIGTFTSGQPFTALLSTSNSRNLSTAGLADRPNLKPGFSNNPTHGVSAGCSGFAAGTSVGNANNWYDPCAFSLPIAGTYGDMKRNTLIGPKLAAVDVAVEKDFKPIEQATVTFRAEAFNVLNHANFGLPNTSALASSGAANPAAGSITYTATSSRQLQFALRINF